MVYLTKRILPFFVFFFSFFLISQFGKHFFLSFSYLSGIRIDYLAPTIYFSDILSVPLIGIVLHRLYIRRLFYGNTIRKHFLFVLVFLFLLCINYFFALSKPLWWYWFFRTVQWGALFLFFYINGGKKKVYSAFLWGVALGGSVELLLALSQLISRQSLQGIWYFLGERSFTISTPGIATAYILGKEFLRPYGTFSHPNSLGGFYLLLYTFILTQKSITNKVLKSGLLLVSSFLIILSFSRTALIVYVLIHFFFFFRTALSCKICTFAKISVAFILIFFALTISGDMNSLNKRTDFFEKSVSIIAQKPFSGTGIGSYLIAQHQYPQKFSTFFEQPVHNIFLLAIAQLGIPLSILVFFSIYRYIEKYVKKTFFFIPFLCILITGSVDHYWLTLQQNVLVLAVLFGILFTYEKKTS